MSERKCNLRSLGPGECLPDHFAMYRVQFGIRAGAWFVCARHMPYVIEKHISLIVEGGMRCIVDRYYSIEEAREDDSLPVYRRIAILRPKEQRP